MTTDSPWVRVRTPVAIPERVTAEMLAALPEETFAELLRSNLMPRDPSPAARKSWAGFWQLLRADQLADRTLDVLEGFVDVTNGALKAGLEDAESQRAARFVVRVEEAWQRVDQDSGGPLRWAGVEGRRYPGRSQRVIARLVAAIDRHRASREPATATAADRELWRVLRKVRLDPADYPGKEE